MVNINTPTLGESKVEFTVGFGGVDENNIREITIREITLGESLLTPGLQTSILVDSFLHASPDGNGVVGPPKNFDDFKNKIMDIRIERKILEDFGMDSILDVSQRIYRIDKRDQRPDSSGAKSLNNNNEQFRIHACDDSLLNDARSLVSQSWKCTAPSTIVSQILQGCAGVQSLDVESCTPMRDYIAENIHPFQVVTQQANAALANGNDPSFVHYMTYQNLGTHHFRSIYSLTKEAPAINEPFVFSETGSAAGYGNPLSIMTYNFPCDFDLLSDILNGIDVDGSFISSMVSSNPMAGTHSLFGNQAAGCGIGGGNMNLGKSNFNTEQDQDQCASEIEKYLLKRQARMSLLEQDKIALSLTVPWNPMLHAGKMIDVEFPRKGVEGSAGREDKLLYGSGRYLIVNLKHSLKSGGFSTTTMECVAQTAGQGIV
jgi:hypothetical protein